MKHEIYTLATRSDTNVNFYGSTRVGSVCVGTVAVANGGGGGASRQLNANPRSDWYIGGAYGKRGEPRTSSRRPPTSLYSAGDRGPPTITNWVPPIRAQVKGARWAVGPTRERSI
jgi:hypothetical protein